MANRQAHKYNRQLAETHRQKQIDGILQAMRLEMQAVLKSYQLGLGARLEKLPEGNPLLTVFKTSREYCIVYPNNTEITGQIEEKELCAAIINTYHQANVLDDALETNTWNAERLLEFDKLRLETGKEEFQKELDRHCKEMAAWVPRLREVYANFSSETQNLFTKIDNYRSRHPVNI